MKDNIKKFIPPPIRNLAWKIIDFFGYPLLGVIFTIFIRKYRTDGCAFNYPKKLTNFRFRARFALDNYEKDERALLRKYLKKSDRVLEFGACIGVVSCITNKNLSGKGPTAHVVVEANPQLIPFLYGNRHLNNCNFLIEHGAIGEGLFSVFNFHKLIVGSSTILKTGDQAHIVNRTLQDLNEKYGQFNVLIMDIEGGEFSVLKSAKENIDQFRLIIIEIHESIIGKDRADECRDNLKAAGFSMIECQSGQTEAWVK